MPPIDRNRWFALPGDPDQVQVDPAVEPPPYQFDDCERYVRRLAGVDESRASAMNGGPQDIRRFGSEVILGSTTMAAPDQAALVPADYIVSIGDELQITLWGSVDADVRAIGLVLGGLVVIASRFLQKPST